MIDLQVVIWFFFNLEAYRKYQYYVQVIGLLPKYACEKVKQELWKNR